MSIKDNWRTYRTNVLPKDAPMIQVIECRNSFYAGYASFVSDLLADNADVENIMNSMLNELTEFQKELDNEYK